MCSVKSLLCSLILVSSSAAAYDPAWGVDEVQTQEVVSDEGFYLQGTWYELENLSRANVMLVRAIVERIGVEPVAYAVDQLMADVNVELDENGLTPLQLALSAEYYDSNVCIFLLKREARIDAGMMHLVGAGVIEPAVRSVILKQPFQFFNLSKL